MALIGFLLGLMLLYYVVRRAVAHGMRDGEATRTADEDRDRFEADLRNGVHDAPKG